MDTIYRLQDAKALEQWARNRPLVQFLLCLAIRSSLDQPPAIWQSWMKTRGKGKLPNLTVLNTKHGHCALPENYVKCLLEGRC